MPPVSVVVDLPRHLTGHEELLLVDPRSFTHTDRQSMRTKETKSSTIRKWVHVYSAGGNQAKIGFAMMYLASWPLLIVRVMETLKAAQGIRSHQSAMDPFFRVRSRHRFDLFDGRVRMSGGWGASGFIN